MGSLTRRAALALWVAGSAAAGLVWSLPSASKQLDLGSFLVSADAALEGRDPYGRYPAVLGLGEAYEGIAPVNLNPPISLVVVAPLTRLPPLTAAWIWYVASLGCVAASAILLSRVHPARALLATAGTLSLYALWSTLQRGQLYALVLLLVAGAWGALARPGTSAAAGLLMGAAAAFKPQLLLWPVLLAVRGERRTPLLALASAGLFTLAPWALFGPDAFPSWADSPHGRGLPLRYPGGMSLWSIAARAGIPAAGPVASVLLVAGVALWCRWTRPSLLRISAVALVVALLASPVSWLGYALLLLPVGYAFAPQLREVRVAALVLGVPPVALLAALVDSSTHPRPVLASGTLGGMVLLGLLVALLRAPELADEARP